MKLFGLNIGRLAAVNPFETPDVNTPLPPTAIGPEGKVLMPFVEKQPPTDKIPSRQAINLNPRWEPINISRNATAQSVQTAIAEAENGETRELFRFYRDALLGDDHIQNCYNARKIAILSTPIAIIPADKNTAQDKLAAAACKRAILDCENWTASISGLMSSCLWPVAVRERLYRPADAPAPGDPRLQWTLRKFTPVNPMLFCFRWAYLTGGIAMGSASPIQQANLGLTPGNFIIDLEAWEPFFKLWPTDNSGRIIYDAASAQFLDRNRHIVHRGHLLAEEFNDNWGGPFRAILGWWLLRQLGRDWFAQFMQTYGKPFLKAKVDVEDPAALSFMQDAFKLAQRLGGIVIDHEDEVDMVEAMVSGGADGHEKWHNVCNSAISRLICGQELGTITKSSGGLGDGQATLQGAVRDDVRKMDQILLSDTVQKQIFNPFLALNGLTGQVRVSWGGLSEDEAEKTGALLVQLTQSQLEPTDDAMETISERVGFTIQRAAKPEPDLTEDNKGNEGETDGKETAQLRALSLKDVSSRSDSSLPSLASVKSPIQGFIDTRTPQLAAAFRGTRAPILKILEDSESPEDFQTKLAAHYRDWTPARIAGIVEETLQLAAAKGAEKANHG